MIVRLYCATLQFMSRLPVPQRWSQGIDIEHYVRGIVTFPWVGLLLGTLSGLVFVILQDWLGLPLASLGAVLGLALLTGGLHLDGLADTCDGVFSARPKERMLEIMRDSRLGTQGGLALIFVVVAKILVISELALRGTSMIAALAAAAVAGRSAVVLLMYRQTYAREEGMGNLFIGKVTGWQTIWTLLGGLVLCLLLLGTSAALAVVVTAILVWLVGVALRRTLDGQTGDTLGAAIELGELFFLLCLLSSG